jgi:glutathione synthase/RimK-type ligase-like ATP-grasp enzyme
LRVAFQTGANLLDPKNVEENLNGIHSRHTLNPLMHGLLRRGVNTAFHYNTKDIGWVNQTMVAYGYWMQFALRDNEEKLDFRFIPSIEQLYDFDVVFVRGDDFDKTTAEKAVMIDSLEEIVINSGSATLSTRDKFEIPRRFADYPGMIPVTRCVTNEEELLAAWDTVPGTYLILKGRYGSSGKEITRIKRDQVGFQQGKELLSRWGDLVIQEYLSDITEGDYRIVFFDGEIIGYYIRKPRDNLYLTNVSKGGLVLAVSQLPNEIQKRAYIAAGLYPEVRFQGLDFALRTGHFIETNAFPASLGTLNRLYGQQGKRFEDLILDTVMKGK